MLGEPGGETAMDERAMDEWSPFEPTRRVVLAGCSFAKVLFSSHSSFTAIQSLPALAVA